MTMTIRPPWHPVPGLLFRILVKFFTDLLDNEDAKVTKKRDPREFISWVNKYRWLDGDPRELAVERSRIQHGGR